jgi:GDP-L-fucose synthase
MKINFNKIKKIFIKKHHIINVGYGSDMSIKQLINYYCKILNYKGQIIFDKTKPNGTMRKLMDSSIIHKLGWRPKNNIYSSLKAYVQDYKNNN